MRKKTVVFLVLWSLLLGCFSGCGAKETEIPELMEPVIQNAEYRPVDTGNIGDCQVLLATVVPREYAHFFSVAVSITSIEVKIGDWVEEGDILAYADISQLQEQLDKLQKELELENQTYAINASIADLQIALAETKTEQDTLRENKRYDALLHDYRVEKYESEIEELEENIKDGTLRARIAGQVTYTAGITNVNAEQVAVVVSDLTDRYLLLKEMKVSSYVYEEYEKKYIMVEGEEYPVTEIPYSNEEMIQAELTKRYPEVRLECEKEIPLTVGDTYPVYYQEKEVDGVLRVGQDSIFTNGEETYVYVRLDSGEREKRIIRTGAEDSCYVEVLEGLEQGELVYYESTDIKPAEYESYSVELSDFVLETTLPGVYYLADDVSYYYFSEYEGIVVSGGILEGQQVEKGDLLYQIDMGEGNAALTRIQYQMEDENTAYQTSLQSLREQEEALHLEGQPELEDTLGMTEEKREKQLQILQYQKQLLTLNHESSLSQLQEEYDALQEGNDGTGIMSIYAEHSGTIKFIEEGDKAKGIALEEGTRIAQGQGLFYITDSGKDKLIFTYSKDSSLNPGGHKLQPQGMAEVGQQITFSKSEETYYGTCIGSAEEKIFVETVDEKSYALYSLITAGLDEKNNYFYIEMEDESFYENMVDGCSVSYSYVTIRNAVVIPSNLIYKENSLSGEELYYVWKVTEEGLVKQYVQTQEEYFTGTKQLVFAGIKAGDVLAKE